MKNRFVVVKKYWWLILILVLIGGGWYYRTRITKAKELKDKTFIVKRKDLTDSLDLSGEIDAKEKVTLKFQTSGLLTWVGVKEGDTVKKFQTIATLDKRELQNSMNQLLNTYSKTRNDFDQTQYDNRNWMSNSTEAQDAVKRVLQKEQMDLNNAVLVVEAKNLALKFANLYTPIAGIVTKVDSPQAGQNITPTTATFEVINPESLYFSATADQTEVAKFRIGQKGTVTLDSFPDTKINAVVENVAFTPKIGESGTVYELKIVLDKMATDSGSLRMGMTGDATFVLKQIPDVLVIPEAYIKKDKEKFYVTKMVNGVSTKVEVVEGDTIEGEVEIKEGLNENDVIYNQP